MMLLMVMFTRATAWRRRAGHGKVHGCADNGRLGGRVCARTYEFSSSRGGGRWAGGFLRSLRSPLRVGVVYLPSCRGGWVGGGGDPTLGALVGVQVVRGGGKGGEGESYAAVTQIRVAREKLQRTWRGG